MLYIDNGKTVKTYFTSKKVEKAIMTLLDLDEDLCNCETYEGYEVSIREKEKE